MIDDHPPDSHAADGFSATRFHHWGHEPLSCAPSFTTPGGVLGKVTPPVLRTCAPVPTRPFNPSEKHACDTNRLTEPESPSPFFRSRAGLHGGAYASASAVMSIPSPSATGSGHRTGRQGQPGKGSREDSSRRMAFPTVSTGNSQRAVCRQITPPAQTLQVQEGRHALEQRRRDALPLYQAVA
jgi:hypothetical protein